MCGILFDAVGLMAIVMLFNEGDEPPFMSALGASAALSFGALGAAFGLAAIHPAGPLALIVLLPIAAGLLLHIVFDVTLGKAALGGGLFLIYKIVVSVAFAMMFGG